MDQIVSTPRVLQNDWAIVLAAGDGTRLCCLTTDQHGVAVPKQFCSLQGGRTLLGEAIRRAARVVRADRLVVVVAARHRRWWERELAFLPRRNVIVQPENRGTASGILLPLLSILERDHDAHVAVFPSDHFVRDEGVLGEVVRATLSELPDDELVLIGISPDRAETEYGWIVPASGGTSRVSAFVEKPGPEQAESCLSRGGVWNSFLFAAKGAAMVGLCERRIPDLTRAFRAAFASGARDRTSSVAHLYASLDSVDFSRDVLQGSEPFLRLRVAPNCGWTDLGNPERVARCLDGLRAVRSHKPSTSTSLDLSEAIARFRKRELPERVAAGGR